MAQEKTTKPENSGKGGKTGFKGAVANGLALLVAAAAPFACGTGCSMALAAGSYSLEKAIYAQPQGTAQVYLPGVN